jgi:hypothetical protein
MKQSAGLVLLLACLPACAYRYIERRVDALAHVVDEATTAGAATCAPVELALSLVHLEFARHELLEGDAPRAERHLTLAEPNGRAALRLAKEHKCTVAAPEQNPKTSERSGSSLPALSVSRAEARPSTSGSRTELRALTLRSDPVAAAQRGIPHAQR